MLNIIIKKITIWNSAKSGAKTRACLLCGAFLIFLASGCSLNMNTTLAANGSCEVALDAKFKPAAAALFKSLNTDAQGTAAVNVLDAEIINKGLLASKGVSAARITNTAPDALSGKVNISKLETFISGGGGAASPVHFESTPLGGRFSLMLNLKTGGDFLSAISPDLADYVSALFAPAATGESLSRAEYLKVVSDAYGKKISDEIAVSNLNLRFRFPAPIKSAKGLKYNGAEAFVDLPLTDVLTLEKELAFEVIW
ncbi:MAG: hypothetical protein LBG72_01880 [Spirochaetaceae bacterium]|jgi:hypothetical protein|nr:hypothetical protein [Spirochaetaceae bacterium]